MAGSPDADAAAARLRISVELAQRFIPAQSDYGLSAMDQSIAGATAKASTKLALYPLDTWKSRRQAASTLNLRGLWSVAGVYRGVVPKIVLYTPYQAVYMATYTRARDILVAEGSPVCGSNLAFVCAGVSAEIAGSLVRLPMEVWKLRLQLGVYKSTRHAMQDFFRNPWHVYGNFVPQTLVHDCLFSAVSWLVFESCRQKVFANRGSSELAAHESLVLGATAGAVSALVTTPCDVVKTRIIGRESGDAAAAQGLRATALEMYRREGAAIFWRGCVLRIAHLAPSQGVYMLLYEVAKGRIAGWRETTT